MSSPSREQELFLKALDFEDPDVQATFLKEACGGDFRLLNRIQKLLSQQASLSGFMESTAIPSREASLGQAVEVFGDYDLLEEIDRGGMGIVYRAHQRSLERTVALKVILSGQFATKEQIHRFKVEATAAAALQHPHIVAIHDVGVCDGKHFLAMDFVQGQNLAERVGNQPLPAKIAAHYLRAISEAIHFAHEKGILHRDLKPSNILVDAATNQPRVTDFGLAKRMDRESSLTVTGQILGSPNFVAPEQVRSQNSKVGRHSDVYGLGGILYFLLTARPPFQGDALEMTLHQVLHDEPVAPRILNPSVPSDLETICLKCLNKEPGQRYPTARQVEEELDRFIKGEPTKARPLGRLGRAWRWCRRKPTAAGLISAVALLILTLSIGSPIVAWRIQKARMAAESHLYSADLNMVQTALADADLEHARFLLDRHRPLLNESDPRGFEWRYLWSLCQSDERQILEPRVIQAISVLFSTDGQLIASGNQHGSAGTVWDSTTKTVVKSLPDGDIPLAFSPTEPVLITRGIQGIKRWNTQTWESEVFEKSLNYPNVIFSPDGQFLVVYDIGLKVWNTKQWSVIRSNDFGKNHWWVHSTLSLSHDGNLLSCATGHPFSTDAEVRIFNFPSLTEIPWSSKLPKDVSSVMFHPSRDLLITGGWSGNIRMWNSISGDELPSLMNQTSRIMAMSFNPVESSLLATTGGERSIRIWNIDTQTEYTRLHGARAGINAMAYSPDGTIIATGGQSNPVTLWKAEHSKDGMISIPTALRQLVLGYSDDGRRILTLDITGRVRLRDSVSLEVLDSIAELDLKFGNFFDTTLITEAVCTDQNLKRIALGWDNGEVEIWNVSTGQHQLLHTHAQMVRGLAFSPIDSNRLVTVSEDRAVQLWDLETSNSLARYEISNMADELWAVCVRFSPNGELVAVGAGDHLSILQGSDFKNPIVFTDLNLFLSLRFSPDGRFLVSGHNGPTLRVWDTITWKAQSLPGHTLIPADIAFSPDGRRMVSAGEKMIFWDTQTWQPLARFTMPIQDIGHFFFSPDGNNLITSDAKALRIWRAPSLEEISYAETSLGRWP